MSHLFELHTVLRPSINYRRLGLLLNLLALLGLHYSDPPVLLLILIMIALSVSFWSLIKSPYPHPDCKTVAYVQKNWRVERVDGSYVDYEHMHMAIDTGLFLLLRFSKPATSRLLVIFYDQLSSREITTLRILNTIL